MLKTTRIASLITALVALAAVPIGAPTAGADSCAATNVRWASSSNTVYVSGPVSCTLTQLHQLLPKAPITETDPSTQTWYLGASLTMQQGAEFDFRGSAVGGDVDHLRLKSDNSSTAGSIVVVKADYGTIELDHTAVTSWNDATSAPDTEYATYGRAYFDARSSFASDGVTPQVSRMDVLSSDISYLGSHNAEAYGLSWKDNGPKPDPTNKVKVLGNIEDSHMHNMYFGAYTFGGYGMTITGNEFDHNVGYGFDSHDDSNYLDIEHNYSHDNGDHGIICSQRCSFLTIKFNQTDNNTGNGIMLHRGVNHTTVDSNTATGNSDSGVAIFDSSGNTVTNNTLTGNEKGVRLSVGSANNLVQNNIIKNSTQYGFYAYQGTDKPQYTTSSGRPTANQFIGNTVTGSTDNIIKFAQSDQNVFSGNTFTSNPGSILFEQGVGNTISGTDLTGITVGTKAEGASASTTLSQFKAANIAIDSAATTTLTDPNGFVFDQAAENLVTTVTPSGSTLLLNNANIGTASTVYVRNLSVKLGSGSVKVDPTSWASNSKTFTSQASSSSQSATYNVGDLSANTTYKLFKNGSQFGTATTDANGVLQFTATLGTTGAVTYQVSL